MRCASPSGGAHSARREPTGGIDPIELIYRQKSVKGWYLGAWLTEGGHISTLSRLRAARLLVNPGLREGGWAETTFEDCTLDTFWPRFLEMYNSGGFTNTKLRIRMT